MLTTLFSPNTQFIFHYIFTGAATIKAQNPDHATQDLWEAIANQNYPQWRFCIQVMTEEQAEHHADNPFDLTKVWKHSDYPLIEVGILELNRNPSNYFAQIELILATVELIR